MKHITIITAAGPAYGTGHLQRMSLLAYFLEKTGRYNVTICTTSPLPGEVSHLRQKKIPVRSDLIIRDMRNSSVEEMTTLRKRAPVLVIDDMGTGAAAADTRINLLPSPEDNDHDLFLRPEAFLYGFTFYRALCDLDSAPVSKNYDIALYCGADPAEKTLLLYRNLIPEGVNALLLKNNRSLPLSGKSMQGRELSAVEGLLAAKVILTYFGITLYEGHAVGCSPAVADPGAYHNTLTGKAGIPGLLNLGIINTIEPREVRRKITTLIEDHRDKKTDPSSVAAHVIKGCKKMEKIIKKTLG